VGERRFPPLYPRQLGRLRGIRLAARDPTTSNKPISVIRNDAIERILRIETLLAQLRAETAISKEEARVISESMAERSRLMQGVSAFKKRRAETQQHRFRQRRDRHSG